ncbi:Mitochondrial group I intron splicing factor dmr1 [Neolecta irregularis DAH-3]|uniref:Mitochondrial group I intron splicing factor dmr1 n=1 Tax=Neolecta irregularis (strain DAH-3) TaxID=1198029 RepID=A0A1U7LVI6_NEOID|nr:Mitochondrial group I intron splicing factor dmr1 [Neolecta irregularis DAH-3]|eukprot:OLL26562.1 Mitochondrial group I intron splicing factor dmr1 [Neolecta irregularis DAH-3]
MLRRNQNSASYLRTALSILYPLVSPTSFVCSKCQRRSRSTQKLSKSSLLLRNIKALEDKIESLQERLKLHEKTQKIELETANLLITDEALDQAYATLNASKSQQVPALPQPFGDTKVAMLIRNRLKTCFDFSTSGDPDWIPFFDLLAQNDGFKGLNIDQVNRFLHYVPSMERGSLVDISLQMLKSQKLEPDILTHDLFLDGLAESKQVCKAEQMFRALKKGSLTPTIYTYAHMLKLYSRIPDLKSASRLFNEMQEAQVTPNLTAYTTLIATAIRAKYPQEAWKIFDLVKFRGGSDLPDDKTYSLMIHACAQTGEAERAFDLLEEMTTRPLNPLTPTNQTFNALLHACAVRKDYFHEVWKVVDRIQESGFKLDLFTWNSLLQACGKNGELDRARIILRKMTEMGRVDPNYAPNEISYQHIFRAYATTKGELKKSTRRKAAKATSPSVIFHITKSQGQVDLILIFAEQSPTTQGDIIEESWQVYQYIQQTHPEYISTQLTNALLSVPVSHQLFSKFKQYYDILYSDNPLNHLPMRNAYTYDIALQAAYGAKAEIFAQSIWDARGHWRRREKQSPTISKEELYKKDFDAARTMIGTLSRCNNLDEACKLLRSSERLFAWTRSHLTTMYVKSVQNNHQEARQLVLRVVNSRPQSEEEIVQGPKWAIWKRSRSHSVASPPEEKSRRPLRKNNRLQSGISLEFM